METYAGTSSLSNYGYYVLFMWFSGACTLDRHVVI